MTHSSRSSAFELQGTSAVEWLMPVMNHLIVLGRMAIMAIRGHVFSIFNKFLMHTTIILCRCRCWMRLIIKHCAIRQSIRCCARAC